MSHGRPPRRARYPAAVNMMELVLKRVTKLTALELEQLLGPVDRALVALREGVATELQWQVLASAVEVALSIEGKGVVRGLRGHFQNAELALAEIRRRAMEDGDWRPTPLYYQELEDVPEAMRLHRYQLEQLSADEVLKAVEAARTRVYQAGGQVVDARSLEGSI